MKLVYKKLWIIALQFIYNLFYLSLIAINKINEQNDTKHKGFLICNFAFSVVVLFVLS
jgi:hypothetical protein